MEESDRIAKAMYRFGIIFPLLFGNLTDKEKDDYIAEVCSKPQNIPGSAKTSITRATVLRWADEYRKDPSIDTLIPAGRSDKGLKRSICADTEIKLLALRSEYPDKPIKSLISIAEARNLFLASDTIKISAIYKMFRDHKLNDIDEKAKDLRRFDMAVSNDLWITDSLHACKAIMPSGRKGTAIGIIIMDDKSRLIVNGGFYEHEDTDSFVDCFWGACQKRGLPVKIHTDHGSCFCNDRVRMGCASLEVLIIYDKVRTPNAKGKVERLMRRIRDQFLSLLPDRVLTLEELNIRFGKYIEDYNKTPHSSLADANGKIISPLQSYLVDIKAVRTAPDDLPRFFWAKETRLVSKARTVTLKGKLFQTPLGYSGKKITLRYLTLEHVDAYFNDKRIGQLKEVDKIANGDFKRALYGTDNKEDE